MTSIAQISKAIEQASKEKGVADTTRDAIESILQVITSGFEHREPGWLAALMDKQGSPLFSTDEAADLEAPVTAFLNKLQTMIEQPAGQTGGSAGIDDFYEGFLKQLRTVNQTVQSFAKQFGILKMELGSDFQDDSHPFAPVGQVIGTVIPPFTWGPVGYQVGKLVPLPFRMIVFFGYLALDMARIFMAIPGFDVPFLRKFLSVVAATVDILRGDWKKALLSFAGFFKSSFVWMGFLGKVFLDMFYLIAPSLQEDIGWGVLSVGKSMVVGALLQCFQIFAPYEVRKAVYEVFDGILQEDICLEGMKADAALAASASTASPESGASPESELASTASGSGSGSASDASLGSASASSDASTASGTAHPPSPGSFPTTSSLQALQNSIRRPSYICSDAIKKIMNIANSNLFLKTALQFMRIPTSEYALNEACKKLYEYAGKGKSWETYLAAEGALQYVVSPKTLEGKETAKSTKSIKESMPHALALQYKGELTALEKEKQALETTISTAQPPIVVPSPLPPIDVIIKEQFPESRITAKFKDVMDYAMFLKLLIFVITSKYTNKRLNPFIEQKATLAMPDDDIISKLQELYLLLDTSKYPPIRTKLYTVERLLRMIQEGTLGLIDKELKDITKDIQQMYSEKYVESEKAKQAKTLADLKLNLKLKEGEIKTKKEQIAKASATMVEHLENFAKTSEAVAIQKEQAKADDTAAAAAKAAATAKAATEAAGKTAKAADAAAAGEAKVAAEKAALAKAFPPIQKDPYAISGAIANAIGKVFKQVEGQPVAPVQSEQPVVPVQVEVEQQAQEAQAAEKAAEKAAPVAPVEEQKEKQVQAGGTKKRKLRRGRLTKRVRFNLTQS